MNGPSYLGDVRSHLVERDGQRYNVLTLFQSDTPAEGRAIPDLFEPALVGFSTLALQVRGYERIDSAHGPIGVVQEWHCEPA